MPQTLYRVIDRERNEIVANGLPSYEEAYTIASMYEVDYPSTGFEVESYTHYTVKGLGRDPELH